jgi:hypothetical protein
MVSHDATHAELAKTVDDLTQWLSVVEIGLIGMLDRANEDTIEEEIENVVVGELDEFGGGESGLVNGRGLKALALGAKS